MIVPVSGHGPASPRKGGKCSGAERKVTDVKESSKGVERCHHRAGDPGCHSGAASGGCAAGRSAADVAAKHAAKRANDAAPRSACFWQFLLYFAGPDASRANRPGRAGCQRTEKRRATFLPFLKYDTFRLVFAQKT